MLNRFAISMFISLLACAAGFAAPPNVVIVLADDQGWGDLSVHGNTNISTPRIDSLAADGAIFSRFYVQPVCAPTRAEMLTERYHPRTGVRVPCMARWPAGGIKAGTRIENLAGAIDFLPTLAEFTGTKPLGDKAIDGRSLANVLRGKNEVWPERMIYSIPQSKTVSVRNQDFMMDEKGQLYDLKNDPGQRTAVNDQQPKVTAEFSAAIQKAKDEILLKGGPEDDRPFLIGGSDEFLLTHMPVRDGISEGTIKRSGRAPNCSYFTNRTSKDDRMTWNVAVEKEGLYEVTALYACAPENVAL